MKSKNFPDALLDIIKKATEEELQINPRPVVAFDADGTLWRVDLGESFFQHQIKHCSLPNLPADPWAHYWNWKSAGDPRPAYLWLAQINAGQRLTTVRQWAHQSVQNQSPLPIFSEQRSLIEYFHQMGVQVFVVTASVKWAVEPGAALLGISSEQVLGVKTQVIDGFVTDKVDGVITYKAGKWDALLEATGGQKPFFCAGNTMGDFWLLDGATRTRMAVGSCDPDDELFKSEEPLRTEALVRRWAYYKL